MTALLYNIYAIENIKATDGHPPVTADNL